MRLSLILLRRASRSSKPQTYMERYIERVLKSDEPEPRWNPISGWVKSRPERWVYSEYRPWTSDFKAYSRGMYNQGKKPDRVPVIPIKEWDMFVGDMVEILVGKDKGKVGMVNSIIKERNWVYVEGLNCEYQMIPETPYKPPSCVKKELPLLVNSQVKLADPTDREATDIEWRYDEKGERLRVSKRTGRIIPLPPGKDMGDDLVIPSLYKAADKDTEEKILTKVTFKPKIMTFEEEIMEAMGIKEDRKRAKTYWY